MIDVVKGVEPETGYGAILQVPEAEEAMREHRIRKTKTVCTYCGVGCGFDVWTKDRHILKVAPEHGPANGISTCVKGKFGWGHINSEDRLTTPLIREKGKFRAASWGEALGLVATKLSEIKMKSEPVNCIHLFVQVYERRKLPNAKIGASRDWHEQRR
jgi:formate dehydrogenase major subunit